MTTEVEESKMGRFSVEVELTNQEDLTLAKKGHIAPDQVRRATIRGVVDSGATRLVLPESVVRKLGLEISGMTTVRYAGGQTAERPIAKAVQLSYGGRESTFDAVVEPARESALIGAVVLEVLDFLVDCVGQRLVPRDPKRIISEVE